MSEREIGKKTTLENKIFIILLYFWRTLIDRVADMMRVSIKLNVKCVSLQFQTQWDQKTDEIDRETNSVFCFSLCVLRYSYCYSEMWQIVELAVTSDSATQHCRFPLATSHHLCFFSPFFFFFSSENLLCRQTHTLDLLCQPCETRVWLDDARLSFLCSP